MWIIKEFKRDFFIISEFIIGITLLVCLVTGKFDLSFFKYMINMGIAIVSIGVSMLMTKTVGKSTNNQFKFLAVIYKYIAISVMIMLIIRNHHDISSDKLYLNLRLGIDVFEMIGILAAYRYLDKEFSQTEKIMVSLLFLGMLLYSFIISKILNISSKDYGTLIFFIQSVIIVLMAWAFYLNHYLTAKFDKIIVYRMYLFLGIKLVYHLLVGLFITGSLGSAYYVILFTRGIYIYYLVSAIFYERALLPWNELVKELKVTEEKLNDNENDRDSMINLSHELKTPINVIQSATDILNLTKDRNEELSRAIQRIKKTCYSATKLITNIIDNNRLVEGYLQPKLIACNLVIVLENCVIALMRYNPEWRILFDPQEEEINMLIDDELIQRGMLNLMTLLLSYQNAGNTVSVELRVSEAEVEICIKSPYTSLPEDYKEAEGEYYNCDNINEMASFEFAKKVFQIHEGRFYITNDCHKEVSFYIRLPHRPVLSHTIQVLDYEENMDALLSRIKVQYADL